AKVVRNETINGGAAHRVTTGVAHDEASALLERDHELATLSDALEVAAAQRGGSVVLVAAEAGLGKSMLVGAIAGRARANGVRVLVGDCDDMIAPRAMGPLRDIAHDLGGRLEAVFASDGDVEQVFAALRDILAEQPTLLIFEDVHWADDATL